jgi:uncharacterized protein (DUF924 family)
MVDYQPILSFWFGTLDARGQATPEVMARWFRPDDAFDQEIRDRFGAEHAAVLGGRRDAWLTSPRGRLAYVLVLDQFTRNMFRGTAAAFSADDRAFDAAIGGITRGMDQKCSIGERPFYYMPLMHSEDLAAQTMCVAMFTRLREQQPEDQRAAVDNGILFAGKHRDIIARYGRFPHRNAALGRTSTKAELEFLAGPDSSF